MKLDLSHQVPVGISLRKEKAFFMVGMVCAFLYSTLYLLRYKNARAGLYLGRGNISLRPYAVMEDFHVILGSSLLGFIVLALCMVGLMIYHYAYHHQGSKSIYLMRRLPHRLELHRRCLLLPFLAIIICLLVAAVLLVIYYRIYMTFTPKKCLTPGQWQKLWSVLQ